MKSNKLLFVSALSLITFQVMSPTEILTLHKSSASRMPAAVEKKAPAKKAVAKKPVTSSQMKALQNKLSALEKDLLNKEALLEQKSKEIEGLKNNKNEEKIEALSKLIIEQKADIDKLKTDIKTSEVKDVKVQNNTAVEIVVCKSESKGEKLETDLKKLIEDKELVLKEVQGLKKENEDLKSKLTVSAEVKPDQKTEVKAEEKKVEVKATKEAHKSENLELIALMSQMTTMFTAQMQSQMQMQVQMMGMLSQMQRNNMPEMSPYGYSPSLFGNTGLGYPQGIYGGFPTLGESLEQGSMGLGMSSHSPWSNFQNPYSMIPNLNRQQLPQQADFGFSFNQPMQGFDFSQPATTPALPKNLPELEKQHMTFSAPTISV